jgi:hypothetical protein
MQVINRLELQSLLANVDALNPQLRDAVIFTIQALCAAGLREVASRADIFQGADSSHPRHLLDTLTCFGAGNGRDFIQ